MVLLCHDPGSEKTVAPEDAESNPRRLQMSLVHFPEFVGDEMVLCIGRIDLWTRNTSMLPKPPACILTSHLHTPIHPLCKPPRDLRLLTYYSAAGEQQVPFRDTHIPAICP